VVLRAVFLLSLAGSWFEEAFEEAQCAQALDAGQVGRCLCKFPFLT
jgi:hypothetical protein